MRRAKSRDNSASAARSTLIPCPLHRRDDRDERALDRLVERGHLARARAAPLRACGAAVPRRRARRQSRAPPRAAPRQRRSGSCRCRPALSAASARARTSAGPGSRSCARPDRRRARRTSASCNHRAPARCRSATSRCATVLTSCPILRTPGSSSSGRNRVDRRRRATARRSPREV